MGTCAKVVVRLSVEERLQLETVLNERRVAKKRVLQIRMLLKAEANGPAGSDSKIVDAVEINATTVSRLRHRGVFARLEAATSRRPPRGTRPRKLDGAAGRDHLQPGFRGGASRWTMQMLADRLVELTIVDEISNETVRKTLKK